MRRAPQRAHLRSGSDTLPGRGQLGDANGCLLWNNCPSGETLRVKCRLYFLFQCNSLFSASCRVRTRPLQCSVTSNACCSSCCSSTAPAPDACCPPNHASLRRSDHQTMGGGNDRGAQSLSLVFHGGVSQPLWPRGWWRAWGGGAWGIALSGIRDQVEPRCRHAVCQGVPIRRGRRISSPALPWLRAGFCAGPPR